ncbi:MAG: prepilin-type N-terminal cleavage/methylation domain-containing protein [Phycisphaerales bacterium]|nr:prepilin-type N-terminal cleavage/methylation domain-containing protein [Phycisphaerales bacterium]
MKGRCTMKPVRRTRRGFTLVELLVVVSVIALLISILLPSLRSARDQSKRLVCRSNLRNIWTGILMYSYEYNDRLPYMESANTSDRNADPFENDNPQSVGRVMYAYVNQDSWVCPAAVNGFPANADKGSWKLTYDFFTADRFFQPVPYDSADSAYTRKVDKDPAMTNYIHFDGRPMRLLDGRRYVANRQANSNENEKGFWKVRFPIIADMIGGKPYEGHPIYPHRGVLDTRVDLNNAREEFEKSIGGMGKKTGYHELHADNDRVEVFFTRYSLLSAAPGGN